MICKTVNTFHRKVLKCGLRRVQIQNSKKSQFGRIVNPHCFLLKRLYMYSWWVFSKYWFNTLWLYKITVEILQSTLNILFIFMQSSVKSDPFELIRWDIVFAQMYAGWNSKSMYASDQAKQERTTNYSISSNLSSLGKLNNLLSSSLILSYLILSYLGLRNLVWMT